MGFSRGASPTVIAVSLLKANRRSRTLAISTKLDENNSLPGRPAFPRSRKMSGGADLLRMAGEALYGAQWQSPLARRLGVSARSIRNWCAEKHDCPADIAVRLLPLVRARGELLDNVAAELERKIGG
jgi:hypothetical protein